MECFGKIAPGFMRIRKHFQEKKAKEKEYADKLSEATAALKKNSDLFIQFLSKYNDDNIEKRNCWMHDVDDDRREYHEYRDESRKDRESLHSEIAILAEKLDKNNEITLAL